MCRSKRKGKTARARKGGLRTLTLERDLSVKPVISTARSPVLVNVDVEGIPLRMALDIGMSVSVVSQQNYKQSFSSVKLETTELRLRTCTGEMLKPSGVLHMNVKHDQHSIVLPFHVLK